MSTLTQSDAGADGDTKDAIQRRIIAAIARFFLSTVVVFLFAIVQGFRFGFLQRDYALLALGSVVSVIGAFAFVSGLLPYFFTLYLIAYRGLWRLLHVFRTFSLAPCLSAVTFTIIGFIAIRHLQTITDLTRSARQFQDV